MALWKKDSFFWAGCFAFLLVAMDISVNLGDWTELLWYCPVAATMAAFAFFRKDALWMTVCLVQTVPAQLPWVFDFVLYLFGGGMGRTGNLSRFGPLIFWGSAIVHTAVVPLAVWGVWRLGFHRKAIYPAFISGAALMVASFLFTPEHKNVNCVFYSCDGDDYGLGPLGYFLTICLMRWAVIIPVSFLLLQILFWNILKRKSCQGS